MDQKDRQIIRALQRNGRATNLEIAAEVNLSPSPCLRRMRLLEESGAILGYRVVVDAKAYGLPVTVFVRIRLERHSAELVNHFEKRVRALDEVLECHLMTGPADYLLRVVVSGLDAYEDFIRNRIHPIGGIGSIDTSFVYGTVKNTGVFPPMD
ncbi:Lrp/AsnC family transcriptional regulator [Phaeovulum sp.]|jgi:Lrp/AsnC family leucine-responsive transcriptional regulator|uniref:Lrp/AsnC family transcriptional regulator n=1 Tax=Phaeovulum sp. TaxID=2934796 RepID=UPI0027311C86|nr:Lrp/AsnC family transcriptional regulator [Phaeovulum sp.]MDP1667856.1 Lrp/AsnC family transcriptional regulator [Phaeovulum sp.]MDP2063884.1 Lrp/AsnC family transcriptional regulator [Phaeovulum sp.]MDP3862399.1 Lrp/AsnC family transcriptional regulator [Phaeovulum sp.]MDZ4120433.1 Lrp/AsnC family transcriptional regulator [Phaeovulum sp.]